MDEYLVDMLQCPACNSALRWSIDVRRGTQIEEGEARCAVCGATYAVREGIGVFLTPDLPRNDLWEQAGTGLTRYLTAHPEVELRLMDAPIDTLNPADRLFRSMVLEECGEYRTARSLWRDAIRDVYTPEYHACYQSQIEYLIKRAADHQGPIVDLASGRGALAEIFADRLDNPIVVTDFSPTVLRRDRRVLSALDLDRQVSLLAFDARQTPFRTAALGMLTSNLGLPNIERPGHVLAELRRIVRGEFLAISHFYPESDDAHRPALQENPLLARSETLKRFREAGWRATVSNTCSGRADPTPRGQVLDGFGVDGLPLAPVDLEWGVVLAR
jgi:uncharacterized protein YbaR (Trm112 family)